MNIKREFNQRNLLEVCHAVTLGILGGVLFALPAYAFELGFEDVWQAVERESPLLRSSRAEVQVQEITQSRAESYWYPRLFLTGRVFATNDPGQNFMYHLEQRQIGAADFAPSSLNQPGNGLYQQGALGLDFPLYEGGSKIAGARVAALMTASKKAQAISVRNEQFARVAGDFAALLAVIEEKKQLLLLHTNIETLLTHYAIGSKANPVGYSGLLGLKNLKNRIEGLLVQIEAEISTKKNDVAAAVPESAKRWPLDWNIKAGRTQDLLLKAFPEAFIDRNAPVEPAQVRAMRRGAQALDEAKYVENAKFLPRVGLFAEGDLNAGARAVATSYTGGAYLQWELFSASHLGATDEAALKASAAHLKADAIQEDMRASGLSSRTAVQAIMKTLHLLDESAELLAEQTETARKLFRDGSINALSLVEVMNRRADLLQNRKEAELNLTDSASHCYLTRGESGYDKY